jgi:hypothetical protein
METLIEKLYNNNVVFSYYGFIDHNVLSQVLQITASKLSSNNEDPVVTQRVQEALNDCVENIIRHNFYPDDERLHYKSLLVVSRQADEYLIDTLNVVNSLQKDIIDGQLNYLNTRNRVELEALAVDNPGVPVSSSLIHMMLKADSYDCTFKESDENYLFNINFKVSANVPMHK